MALIPLLLLARDVGAGERPLRAGFGWGLLAGAVFFGVLVRWLIPFGYVAWGLLTAIQALAVAAYVAGLALWGERRGRAVFAVVWWVALEVVRSNVPLGGFGWGTLGATQHDGGFLPMARVLGVYGVSALCAATAVALEGVLVAVWRTGASDVATAMRRAVPGLLGLAGILLVAAAVALVPPPPPSGETLDIAGVQGEGLEASGAAGVRRIATERIVRVAEQMVDATRPLADDPPELTVWPENSLDADVTDPDNTLVREQLQAGLELVDGGPMLVGGLLDGPEPGTLFNSLLVVDDDGIRTGYVKRQPVPFGEYVPARRYLEWFPPLEQLPTDILASPEGAQVIDVAGASIGGIICFENAFAYLAREQVREGAEVLVVATNNASFGRTEMSSQHLAHSQLRAVETGRHVLHAGVSGVSAFVDPRGRISQRTEIFERDIVRTNLPLVEADTIATRLGVLPELAALALAALALVRLLAGEFRAGRRAAR